MEAAERNAKSFSGNESSIKKLQIRSKQRTSQFACTRCGKTNHAAKDCKFKDATCHACGKEGHIAPVCRSQDPHPQRTNRVVQQEEISSSSDSEEFYTLKLTTPATTPIEVTVQIEEKNLTLEIDTGAAVSIISETTRHSCFPKLKLKKYSDIILKTYTDQPLKVMGELQVNVSYGDQRAQLPLIVVAGNGPNLMGRNWLKQIQLNWQSIATVKRFL